MIYIILFALLVAALFLAPRRQGVHAADGHYQLLGSRRLALGWLPVDENGRWLNMARRKPIYFRGNSAKKIGVKDGDTGIAWLFDDIDRAAIKVGDWVIINGVETGANLTPQQAKHYWRIREVAEIVDEGGVKTLRFLGSKEDGSAFQPKPLCYVVGRLEFLQRRSAST